jgi:hypothetical protein
MILLVVILVEIRYTNSDTSAAKFIRSV